MWVRESNRKVGEHVRRDQTCRKKRSRCEIPFQPNFTTRSVTGERGEIERTRINGMRERGDYSIRQRS